MALFLRILTNNELRAKHVEKFWSGGTKLSMGGGTPYLAAMSSSRSDVVTQFVRLSVGPLVH